jgi:CRISPR/Cas system CSM-associated protein Csm3 (group 7 of RAMP superfamily)
MNRRIIINGKIKTMAPLSIKMPKAEGSRENEYDNFPIMTRGVDSEGNKLQTVFLPATTLRGFLRRAVTIRSMKIAANNGKPYKLPQIYSEMIGQDAESEKQAGDIDLLALRKAREASPILDLFGSGLGIKSRLKVGHFVPDVNVLPEVFTGVRKDIDDTEDALELMDKAEMDSFLGRSASNNKRANASSLVKSLEREIKALQRKNEPVSEDQRKALEIAKANEEKFKDEMGDMQNSTRTILQHFAMPAGINLNGRVVIENAVDSDMELIEYALDQLSQNPVLGAHSARGCGEISGSFEVLNSDGVLQKIITIGGFKPSTVSVF